MVSNENLTVEEVISTSILAPWMIYYKQINALFDPDPSVEVKFEQSTNTIKIYVDGDSKAEAISALLPDSKTFGNVTVNIVVIPANKDNTDRVALIKKAFDGNPIFKGVNAASEFGFEFNYAVFKKEVVQYYSDDMSTAGITSTLYQDIAKEVLGIKDGVYFCTDVD